MKKFNLVGLLAIALFALPFIMNFTTGGYRSNNSIILARNMTINSTIDGKINNSLPKIGELVKQEDLLVSLINARIDKSRLIGYQSQIKYTEEEILGLKSQLLKLEELYLNYEKRSEDYASWMIEDLRLKNRRNTGQLKQSKKINAIKAQKAARFDQLFKDKHASNAIMQEAIAESLIAKKELEYDAVQLQRSQLMLDNLAKKGVFFEDGETSYWEKMLDTISIRKLDTNSQIMSLNAELSKLKVQEIAEHSRIDSNYSEKIRAPFSGIVSSVYVNNNSNVTSGTSLMQILDCSDPVIIVPIPEHKLGDFTVGMRVTINPIDSDYTAEGKISYISSGPILANDKTISLQSEMTLSGNKAIVSIDNLTEYNNNSKTCDISRKAIVVIHT